MTSADDDIPVYGPLFWLGLLAGGALVAVGVRGLLHDRLLSGDSDLARWFLGAGIVHDALLAPVFVAVGWMTRNLPAPIRTPARFALAATALVTAIAWPLVRGWGYRAANPSALPLDYGRNLGGVLVAIWVVALIAAVLRTMSRNA